MKLFLKIALSAYVLVGVIASQVGLATHGVLDLAGESPQYDHVYKINDAYIGTNTHLYICVDGSYSHSKKQYWIMVPVLFIEQTPDKLDGVDGYYYYWRESVKELWHLPRANIRVASCDQRPNVALRTVRIQTIEAGMTGSYRSKNILDDDFLNRADPELVYQLNVTNSAGEPAEERDMAYANRGARYGDKHAMMFRTIHHIESGSVLWYLVLPFAWLLDVIVWPGELALWIAYADAH